MNIDKYTQLTDEQLMSVSGGLLSAETKGIIQKYQLEVNKLLDKFYKGEITGEEFDALAQPYYDKIFQALK